MIYQQIPTPTFNLYIISFNIETNIIKLRDSREPQFYTEEKIDIKDNNILTQQYHFPIYFLQRFIQLNELI
jgi:hypothetical protein